MIKLGKMRWSWMFSYGADNEIDFKAAPLTQLVGQNGQGKSSIGLILEEILWNKNSKNIKKTSVLNRLAPTKTYSGSLEFWKDNKEYLVDLVRGSTISLHLYCDGEDISSHTSTGTLKMIETLMGMDHKTFSQIVYQSSAQSLEFLTTTDTNRKKFLIELFQLERYVQPLEKIKQDTKSLELLLAETKGKLQVSQQWLASNKNVDLVLKTILNVPSPNQELSIELSKLKLDIENIGAINKTIIRNNKYGELLKAIKPVPSYAKPNTDISGFQTKIAQVQKTIQDSNKLASSHRDNCPTCKQPIKTDDIHKKMVEDASLRAFEAKHALVGYEQELRQQKASLAKWEEDQATNIKYEELHSLFDTSQPTELLDLAELNQKATSLEKAIQEDKNSIKNITTSNNLAIAHNSRVELIQEQIGTHEETVKIATTRLVNLTKQIGTLLILQKTFSASGLVAYKLESLVKDLEDATNKYLSELGGGRFQLLFRIEQSDKLNVVIVDNGTDIEIESLSNGEKARVNVAALLGIRKLLLSLSNNRINLLFLDETIDNLDIEGKEKLVEILLDEPELNTFIVSHGFTHPLLDKIQVIKTNNISRIE